MKPLKGTKGRKPKPHSKGGKRATVAKTARRATPATRGQHSRAEVKRGAAAKAAAEASAAGRLGNVRKRPVQRELSERQGPMRRIDVEPPDPLAPEQAPPAKREALFRHLLELNAQGLLLPPTILKLVVLVTVFDPVMDWLPTLVSVPAKMGDPIDPVPKLNDTASRTISVILVLFKSAL